MSKRLRAFTLEDLLSFSLSTDVQRAPDGETVVYAQRSTDVDNDTYTSKLWPVPTRGGEGRQFTTGSGMDTSPRWSPDGRRIGTSDSGYHVTPHAMGGEIDERRETYERLSPVRWLAAATTPTSIFQGEDDPRCPIGQAEEAFATLVRAGRAPVEFVRYPGGDHHLAEQGTPSHRVDYTRRIVGWVRRWTRMQR